MLKNNLKGVTILETLVVLTIVVILSIIAIPSLFTFLQGRRLTLTAESMFNAIQMARSEAIKRNATIYVSFHTGDSWCYGIGTASTCNCSTPNTCDIATDAAPTAQQITLSTGGLSSNAFQFEGTRGASNVTNGTITLTLYGGTTAMSIVIYNLGSILLCSSTVSGYQTCP